LTLFGIPYFHNKIPPKKLADSPDSERMFEAFGFSAKRKVTNYIDKRLKADYVGEG
jgi:hypothetical protein